MWVVLGPLAPWILGVCQETGHAVLLYDDVSLVHGNDLLHFDVLVSRDEQEVGAIPSDAFVLLECEGEPLEASAGSALTDEFIRRIAAERGRDPDDVLV